jgi:DNA repair protein RadD
MNEINLYPFQADLVERVESAFASGHRSVLLQLPTGGGKTLLASSIMKHRLERKKERSIAFAHRREIVHQTADKLEKAGMHPQILMAGYAPDPWADVDVASVDTVWARKKGLGLPDADFVVIDECHRVAEDNRYGKIIRHYIHSGARVLGLSATPIRMDGKGLKKSFDHMICGPTVQWMIEHGYLSPVSYRVGMVPDKKGWKVVAADYSGKQADEFLNRRELIGNIVENWMAHASNRPTMLFAFGVRHSMAICETFNQAGITAVHIDGNTDVEKREAVYDASRRGEIKVICNDSVYVEGTDFPWIECIVDVRPTKSLVRYLQAGGRGLRTFPGKERLIYLDHSGNVSDHGRLEMFREWELTEGRECAEKIAVYRQKHEPKQTPCPKCGFLLHGPSCGVCGFRVEKKPKDREIRDGLLVDLDVWEKSRKAAVPQVDKQAWFSGLVYIQKKRNYKPGWAMFKYKEKFGDFPPKTIKWNPVLNEDVERWVKYQTIRWAKAQQKKNRIEALAAQRESQRMPWGGAF